jgi:hypothetical protein
MQGFPDRAGIAKSVKQLKVDSHDPRRVAWRRTAEGESLREPDDDFRFSRRSRNDFEAVQNLRACKPGERKERDGGDQGAKSGAPHYPKIRLPVSFITHCGSYAFDDRRILAQMRRM